MAVSTYSKRIYERIEKLEKKKKKFANLAKLKKMVENGREYLVDFYIYLLENSVEYGKFYIFYHRYKNVTELRNSFDISKNEWNYISNSGLIVYWRAGTLLLSSREYQEKKRKNKNRRNSQPYRNWKTRVFERDNHTCTNCGSGQNITVHHVKKMSEAPELRLRVDNGLTLCQSCHADVHGTGSQ